MTCPTCKGTCLITRGPGLIDACPTCAAIAEAEYQMAHSPPTPLPPPPVPAGVALHPKWRPYVVAMQKRSAA